MKKRLLGKNVNWKYLIVFIILLITIIAIAFFSPSGFIRNHFGDILIVILIYCLIRIFVKRRLKGLWLYIFIFAVFVEVGQYLGLVRWLGLENWQFAQIAIGTSFDIIDLVMYFIGCIIILIIERLIGVYSNNP